MLQRIGRLRELTSAEGVDAFLALRPENRMYLTGFTGSSGAVLITGNECILLTDFRYDEQARKQSPHCRVVMAAGMIADTLAGIVKELELRSLGCEGDYITYQQYVTLGDRLENCAVIPLYGIIESLRMVKDNSEADLISRAAGLADSAFNHVLPLIREGVSEVDLALEIEYFMRRNGAEGMAFTPIVASGERSAMPHGTATEKILKTGDLLIMDFGPVLSGYCADITRTVAVGSPDLKMDEIYKIVLEAQKAGLDAVREGVAAAAVDRAVRSVIESSGYGERFGHSTGHGLGLQIHESPRLSSSDETVLGNGMVVTVEPGIYLPGWGGVRIEDTVLVEDKGCRVLTSSPKETLMVCG